MEILIDFTGGGPFDGRTMEAGKDRIFQQHLAEWLVRVVAVSLEIAQKEERPPGNLATWRVPIDQIKERANQEGWSEAKLEYYMKYHEYHVVKAEEADGVVFLTAKYNGTAPKD